MIDGLQGSEPRMSAPASVRSVDQDLLRVAWAQGYSVAELWGASKPVSRGVSFSEKSHLLLWGILSIVEYQVDQGAGHRYLRDRLAKGDWTAIGILESRGAEAELTILPPIDNAKFGKKASAVGDGNDNYVNVRILHSELFREIISHNTALEVANEAER